MADMDSAISNLTPENKASQDTASKAPLPSYAIMITAAINALADKQGSARQDITKYIVANYDVDESKVGNQLKNAMRRLTKSGVLTQTGTGAMGCYQLGKGAETPTAPAKPPKAAPQPRKQQPTKPKAPRKAPASQPRKRNNKGKGKRRGKKSA